MDGSDPAGAALPLWWTLRAPCSAADLPRGAPDVRAGQRRGPAPSATLHALRHTAAYRMAEDPALPLTDVQFVLGHAQLTTTQIYLTPRKEDVIRRVLAHHAEQTARRPRGRRRRPRRATGPRPSTCCSGQAHERRAGIGGGHRRGAAPRPHGDTASGIRPALARRQSGRPRGRSATRSGSRMTSRALRDWRTPYQRNRRRQGGRACWTGWGPAGPRPGSNGGWPAERTRRGQRGGRCRATWLRARGHDGRRGAARRWSGALAAVIGADVLRPSLAWLVTAARRGEASSSDTSGHCRDPEGFARLRALCDGDAGHVGRGAGAACSTAAP